MKHTTVLTYRLTGSNDLTVAEFNSDSQVDMAKFDALLNEVRAMQISDIPLVVVSGCADHFYVEHRTEV